MRAILLEILTSLETDAFLNAVTGFSTCRGLPEHMRSDNGTNMVCADKELQAAVKRWENDKHIQNTFLKKQIDWVFNPPTASHIGGIWERQIRTVRKVLRAIIGSQVLDDELLHTLFCEAETVVNGRPITAVLDDPNDMEALTHSHLLRVEATYPPPFGWMDPWMEKHIAGDGNMPVPSRSILETMASRVPPHITSATD